MSWGVVENATALARSLPSETYTSQAYLDAELDRLFFKEWLYACPLALLPDERHAIPIVVAGQPVLLVKDDSGSIAAFHNVCPHRGVVLVAEPCRVRQHLVCPYHGWQFSFSGRLIRTPHFGGHGEHTSTGFESCEHSLRPIRAQSWAGALFINFSNEAPGLSERLAELAHHWRDYDFTRLRYGGGIEKTIEANWKLAVENFVESYHLPSTHPHLNSVSRLDAHSALITDAFISQLSHHYDSQLAGHGALPRFVGLPEQRRSMAEYPALMPNVMIGIHPDYLFFYVADPISPGRSRQAYHFYFVGDEAMSDHLADARHCVIEQWRAINEQDVAAAMTYSTLFIYFSAAFLVLVIPGPAVILAITNGAQHGLARASWGMVGAIAADLAIVASVACGLGTLLATSQSAFNAIKWAGAAYIC